jgi:hypothetical protein
MNNKGIYILEKKGKFLPMYINLFKSTFKL